MTDQLPFKISLAQWSLNKTLFAKKLDNLDFPAIAKNEFGIDAVEYVNQFFMDKATNKQYLAELKQRAEDVGVANVLIMCDHEGEMASEDVGMRKQAVENHFKWVDAAQFLGCKAIRVNCFGQGAADEMAKASTESLRMLCEYAKPFGINVLVENHGGFSSNGLWLANVISKVRMENCGTLPDFGNFCMLYETPGDWTTPCLDEYDRYKGVAELMPYAKGISAKSMDFDAQGNCIETDYLKMISIMKKSNYTGYVRIEYAGSQLSEPDGIKATKNLLSSALGHPKSHSIWNNFRRSRCSSLGRNNRDSFVFE